MAHGECRKPVWHVGEHTIGWVRMLAHGIYLQRWVDVYKRWKSDRGRVGAYNVPAPFSMSVKKSVSDLVPQAAITVTAGDLKAVHILS